MKKLSGKHILALFSLLFITACSDNDSSSEESVLADTMTDNNGTTVRFSSRDLTVGGELSLTYDLDTTTT